MGMVKLSVALPKGHLWDGTKSLLDEAGYGIRIGDVKSYSARSIDPTLDIKIHTARDIARLVGKGVYDIGVTGLDWIRETPKKWSDQLEELMDLEFGKVDIVAAVPQRYGIRSENKNDEKVFNRLLNYLKRKGVKEATVVSEYEKITRAFWEEKTKNFPYDFIRPYGATETFLYEIADLIVECSETGESIANAGGEIIYSFFTSTARLIAYKPSLQNPEKKEEINNFLTALRSAKEATSLTLLKMNAPKNMLGEITKIIPAMKSPTVTQLYGDSEYVSIEAAVPKERVFKLITELKNKGATDILETSIKKAVR